MSDDDDYDAPNELDQYLFINCAVPNSVNMSAPRDDKRVAKMMKMRDEGKNPSIVSSASFVTTTGQSIVAESSRPPPRYLVSVEEDDAPPPPSPPPPPRRRHSFDDDDDEERRVQTAPPSPIPLPDEEEDVDYTFTKAARQRAPYVSVGSHQIPIISVLPNKGQQETPPRRRRAESPPPPSPVPPPSPPVSVTKEETPYEKTLREMMQPPAPNPPPPPPVQVRSQYYARSVASSRHSAVESSVSHPNHSSQTSRKNRHSRHNHRSSRHRYSSPSADSRLAEIERENKMELLIELEKMQAMGIVLSFPLSMDLPEWRLKHELERHQAHQTLVQRITLVKGIMKLGSMIIRWVCSSFLRLDGWDKFIGEELDSGKYDVSLEQVYRSIWRKGAPNPWISLGLLVFGSAIAFHVGSLASNGQASTSGPNGPGGMIGSILSSLFGGKTGGGGAGSNPMTSLVGSMLQSAGGGTPKRASSTPPIENKSRAPSPPPPKPEIGTPRARPRIPPPS